MPLDLSDNEKGAQFVGSKAPVPFTIIDFSRHFGTETSNILSGCILVGLRLSLHRLTNRL